jgi:hypothetical protein
MEGKQTMQKLCYKSALYLKRHSATILTCVGAIGVVATAITAVRATPKAIKLLEEATDEKGKELTKLEVVAVAGPVYIPSVAIGVSTIACIFGANTLNKRQQAALTSAYALIDQSYKEYRNKLKELYGEETDIQIRDAIAKDKRNEDVIAYAPGLNGLVTKGEMLLFYEEYRGSYFEASMEEVINAEYHLNRNLALRGFVTLNEFYSFLGLDHIESGDVLGWGAGEMLEGGLMPWIDFDHRLVKMEDGMECYIIDTMIPPTIDYDEY